MQCRNCGTEIADKAIVCYRCGTATTDPVRKPADVRRRRSARLWIWILVVLALLLGLLFGFYHPGALSSAHAGPPGGEPVLINFAPIHA